VQSGGTFEVKISGNGTATLSDLRQCADSCVLYVRNPAYWIFDEGHTYNFTRFLLPTHPMFRNLTGCARQWVSTPDYLLILYGSGWVCPSTIRAVYGAAGLPAYTSPVALGLALLVSLAVHMLV